MSQHTQRISLLHTKMPSFENNQNNSYNDWPFLSPSLKENYAQMEFQRQEPEGATVKRWREGDDHVQDGHGGQEEDEQKHAQVEIIRSGSFEDSGLRDIATHHGPALEVHGCVESKDIDAWEAGSKERAHPRKENRTRVNSGLPSRTRPHSTC